MRKGDIVWGLVFAGLAAFIAIPATRALFIQATNAQPFLMGFIKFAILASMGEFLAIRIVKGHFERPSLKDIVGRIDWAGFIGFVVGKTIPLFWIPAHTLTFMLPGEYRVLIAAFLSIALGAILSLAKARKG
jgi:hypothetical protein